MRLLMEDHMKLASTRIPQITPWQFSLIAFMYIVHSSGLECFKFPGKGTQIMVLSTFCGFHFREPIVCQFCCCAFYHDEVPTSSFYVAGILDSSILNELAAQQRVCI